MANTVMKLAACLLAFVILFLSTQCMLADHAAVQQKTASKKSCCSSHKKCDRSRQKDGRSCKGMCNPFMVCSGSSFIAPESIILQLKLTAIKSPVHIYKKGMIVPAYVSSTWHPPETV